MIDSTHIIATSATVLIFHICL